MLTITLNNLCLLGPLTEVHYNAFPIERQDITPYAVLSQHPNQLNYKELDQLSNTLHARTVQTSTLWRARRTAPNPILEDVPPLSWKTGSARVFFFYSIEVTGNRSTEPERK